MTEEKLVDLAIKLGQKTAAGSLKWERTADVNRFQAPLSKYFVLIAEVRGSREPIHLLSIVDRDGTELETVGEYDLIKISEQSQKFLGKSVRGILGDIYTRARRKALSVDSAIDNLLSEL